MLDVKEAAQKAADYFAGLYAEQGISNVQLEEVELTEDGRYWHITLSFPVRNEVVNFNFKRKYKVFTIDASTGEVRSMKIRKVE